MFKLVTEQGEHPGKEFVLREGTNMIGRSHEVDVRLTAEDISSRQARVIVQGRKVWVENISRFGTWVNEHKLEKEGDKIEIIPGQQVRLGKECVLRLEEASMPATESGDRQPSTHVVKETVVPTNKLSPTDSGTHRRPTLQPVPSKPGDEVTVTEDSTTGGSPVSGSSKSFERAMHVKAEAVNLDEDWDESTNEKTRAQKTLFATEEELAHKRERELRKQRQRVLLAFAGVIIGIILFVVFNESRKPEEEYKWDGAYGDGTVLAPCGKYKLVCPSNETFKMQASADGLTIATRLGRKRDVPLIITLSEKAGDRWALQDSSNTVEEWIKSNPDKMCNRPGSRFVGTQSGVRLWEVSYKKHEWAGRASLFCDGRRFAALCVEIPTADQTRAENFLYYANRYLEFSQEFEQFHWEGCAPSADIPTAMLLNQVRDDIRREAPSTWMMVERQLRMTLSKAVAEKQPAEEKEALNQLVILRKKEALWFNSQQLQVVNTIRFREKQRLDTLTQRCRAVFSDMNDRRYYEVRAWRLD